MYQDYIDGKKEIRDINMEFRAHYESGIDGPEKNECGYVNRNINVVIQWFDCIEHLKP